MSDLNSIPRNLEGQPALKRPRINEVQNDSASASASAAAPRVSAGKMEDDAVMHDQSIVERSSFAAPTLSADQLNAEEVIQDYVSNVGRANQTIRDLLFCYNQLLEKNASSAAINLNLAAMPIDIIKNIILKLIPDYVAVHLSMRLPLNQLEDVLISHGINMQNEYAAIDTMARCCFDLGPNPPKNPRMANVYLDSCYKTITGLDVTDAVTDEEKYVAAFEVRYGRERMRQFKALLQEFVLLPSQILVDPTIEKGFVNQPYILLESRLDPYPKKKSEIFCKSMHRLPLKLAEYNEVVTSHYKGNGQGSPSLQFMGNLQKQRNLYLDNVAFYPHFTWNPSQLNMLALRKCGLRQLPSAFFQATGLEKLDISDNEFTELAPRFKKFAGLEEINISGNNLSVFPLMLLEFKALKSIRCERMPQMAMRFDIPDLNVYKDLSLNSVSFIDASLFKISSDSYHISENNILQRIYVAAYECALFLTKNLNPILWCAALEGMKNMDFLRIVFDDYDTAKENSGYFLSHIECLIDFQYSNPLKEIPIPDYYFEVVKDI